MSIPILFDKSAFQSLSYRELLAVSRYFIQNVPPILVHEVVGDLKKQWKRAPPKEEVAKLAQKLGAAGGAIAMSHTLLLRAELDGSGDVPMTGQIIPDNMFVGTDQNGEAAGLINPSPLDDVVLRLADQRVEEADEAFATRWRTMIRTLSLNHLEDYLRHHAVILPRAGSLAELTASVDSVLRDPHLQPIWIGWMVLELGGARTAATQVLDRWGSSGRPQFADFAPFANHCLRALLLLHAGSRFRVVGRTQPTDVVDLQYLYYAPFVHVVVSDDHIHRALAPSLMRPYQRFVAGRDFKAAIRQIADHLDAQSPEDRRASGTVPPALGNLINAIWDETRRRTDDTGSPDGGSP